LQAFRGENALFKGEIAPGKEFPLESAIGEKYRETIDDRVAAGASATQNDLRLQSQFSMADGADEVEKVLLDEHLARGERLIRRS
jgi:hypothetical protein